MHALRVCMWHVHVHLHVHVCMGMGMCVHVHGHVCSCCMTYASTVCLVRVRCSRGMHTYAAAPQVFLMVQKSEGAEGATRTNLRVAPNHHKVAIRAGEVTWRQPGPLASWLEWLRPLPTAATWFEAARRADPARFGAKARAWYIRHDWDEIERYGCNAPLRPGDALVMRSDVWHRTQDIEQDRMLLKLDVYRPLMERDRHTEIPQAKTARLVIP